MALTPEEQAELDQLLAQRAHAAPTGAGGAAPLEDMLDPSFDLVPQALATQPSTTHPGGDEKAESEFLRKPGEASKGTVFVYEPPLAVVQKRLASDPAFGAALSPSLPPDPDRIAKLTRDDSLYQMAADQMWRETADATAKSGNTAYRYSKAPWLQGGGAMNAIRSLGMKGIGAIGPAMETVNSFVMGVDKTALLGAARAVDETISGGDPKVVPGIEQAGIPQENVKQYNERTIEEHPVANMTGQGLALLKPWGAANMLYKAATGLTGKAAAAAGGGLTARVLAGGAGAALGGGAVQAGQDVVQAGGNIAQTGSPGITGGEIASRAGQAAIDPLNVGLGASLEGLGSLTAVGANQFREGPRYGGAPGRFERLGGEFKMGKGPVAPEPLKAAEATGKALDVKPVDVLAKEIAPAVAEAEAKAVKDVKLQVEARNAPFYQSREGKLKLPVEATQNEALTQLREKHTLDAKKGRLAPINGQGDVDYTKKFFNRNIDGVSLKPSPGAIELSPDEAEAFLNGQWKRRLLPKPPKGGGEPTAGWKPLPKPEGGGAPSAPVESARPTGAETGSLSPEAKPSAGERPSGKPTFPAPTRTAGAADLERRLAPGADARTREARRMEALDKETTPATRDQVQENLKKALTPEEQDAIGGRKFARFYEANDALRGKAPLTPELKAQVEAVNKIFEKAQSTGNVYSGKTVRGIRIPAEEAAKLESAKTLNARGFMSSSVNTSTAKHFEQHGGASDSGVPVRFEIEVQNGIPIGHTQGEVISRPGTRFDVVGKKMDGQVPVYLLKESGYDPGGKSDAILAGGLFAVGAGANVARGDDKEGTAQAGAGAIGLAMLLKKKGINKVYVSPKRYTASEHEVLKDHLQTLSADPQSPEGRQARQLYKAAFIDRDARPMNGVPGGWSAHQNENSKMIEEVKSRAALAAPGGDSFGALVDYSKQREGQLPLVEAVRSAAERAGVRPQLDQLRMLDPHQSLINEMSMGRAGTGRGVSPTVLGAANRFFDAGAMRFGYPALQYLSGQPGPIRGGMAGRAGSIKREEKKDKTP